MVRLWNDPKYPDLTVELSDGCVMHLHKFVVCNMNDYFDKLCGEGSHFAVSKSPCADLTGGKKCRTC